MEAARSGLDGSDALHTASFDVWNEPNAQAKVQCSTSLKCVYDANLTAAAFYALYDRAHAAIRSALPSARILAPSIADGGPGIHGWSSVFPWLRAFLLHARAADTLPDVLTWHVSMIGANGSLLVDHHAELHAWAASLTPPLVVPPIGHNEVLGPAESLAPAAALSFAAALETLAVDHSCRACWTDPVTGASPCDDNTLDALLTNDCNHTQGDQPECDREEPRSVWWVYKWIAELTGARRAEVARVGVECAGDIAVLAGWRDNSSSSSSSSSSINNTLTVLVGRWADASVAHLLYANLSVDVSGVSSGAVVNVDVERIVSSGRKAASAPTLVVRRTNVSISAGGVVKVVVNRVAVHDVYRVVVSMMTTAPPVTIAPTCNTVALPGVDLCAGYPGYTTREVSTTDACSAACCAAADACASWVTRPTSVATGNCSAGSQCCWLKPQDCRGAATPSPTAVSGTVVRATPPQGAAFVDTATWFGTSYTPARASNQLWWADYPSYRDDVIRELTIARATLEITAIRVFLHTLAWESVGKKLHSKYITDFLAIAESVGLRVGLVLFGDGWNHGVDLPHTGNRGANVSCTGASASCCPVNHTTGFVGVRGCSNGCWFANPQDEQRGTPGVNFDDPGHFSVAAITAAFKPYVDGVVAAAMGSAVVSSSSSVVAWLEVYNEPCEWRHYEARICTKYEVLTSTLIKELAFGWVRKQLEGSERAAAVAVPVISSWDERNNSFSDVLSVHLYSDDFGGWGERVFAECPLGATDAARQCTRGAVVTEAGARWGSGSPLDVVHFLSALRAQPTRYPFVPGAMLAWTLFVGNDNTRWSSGPPCAPVTPTSRLEPPIPWCGLLFPDGTPVSVAEAAAIRLYARGLSRLGGGGGVAAPFLLEDFMLPVNESGAAAMVGESTFNVSGGSGGAFVRPGVQTVNGSVVVEVKFMPHHVASTVFVTVSPSGGEAAASASAWRLAVNSTAVTLMQKKAGAERWAQLAVTMLPPREVATVSSGVVLGQWNIARFVIVEELNHHVRVEGWLNPLAQAGAKGGPLRALVTGQSVNVPPLLLPRKVRLAVSVEEEEDSVVLDFVGVFEPDH
tara:strand:- start:192 stop:3446 length:3255 start_codon:yes stop_codon:yes gene_type:complete